MHPGGSRSDQGRHDEPMKAATDQGYFAALAYDLRVRERLLAAGVITQADLERYLTELPELETVAEGLGIAQPALVTSTSAPAPAPVAMAAAPAAQASNNAAVVDDTDDDIDDSDDDDAADAADATDEAGEA
jgi:hypothetical protein